jgi:hypothetical protein
MPAGPPLSEAHFSREGEGSPPVLDHTGLLMLQANRRIPLWMFLGRRTQPAVSREVAAAGGCIQLDQDVPV